MSSKASSRSHALHAVLAISLALWGFGCSVGYAASTTETLVFVRHGEKPIDVDNGQLTCQGFNRAAALPPVLLGKFGTPDYLFAAAPVEKQDDQGNHYFYLRALATIEPTAVASAQTINLGYEKNAIDDLEKELMKPSYDDARVFVAWEHTELDKLVANIVRDTGGDASLVPAWQDDDYDGIFVVSLTRSGNQTSTTFTRDSEGLDDQDPLCPSASRSGVLPPSQQPRVRSKGPGQLGEPSRLH